MKTSPITVGICQVRPVVGDIDGNCRLLVEAVESAARLGADLAVLSECVVSGYPAEDLWLDATFVDGCVAALTACAPLLAIPTVIGCPRRVSGSTRNACAFVRDGQIEAWYDKQCLPNYGVFDEERWFSAGREGCVIEVNGVRVGLSICEDVWVAGAMTATYPVGTIDVLVNLSASPFHTGRADEREHVVARRARELGVPVVLCNQVGGQDELVFDGGSVIVSSDGNARIRCPQFVETVSCCDLSSTGAASTQWLDRDSEIWEALRCGLADYVNKNGFGDVVIGVSGGIDSAVVATLAVDALGASRVHAVTLPSTITSSETLTDAHELARRLGIDCSELAIEPVMSAFIDQIDPAISDTHGPDIMEENLQARIRGTMLMALSNRRGWLVLTTGNKSETAVGYSTLYGDTAGGFAPIKDVPKTLVWRLARWRNDQAAHSGQIDPIPTTTIERLPTAELRPEQYDADSLPEYDVLDAILDMHVGKRASIDQIVEAGWDRGTVERVVHLVRRAEYKRRQSPPGIRVSALAFGRERRMPITNAWTGKLPITT